MTKLQGRVAFITGAGRGQGRAHAVRLAADGADIIALDICQDIETMDYSNATADELEETAALVREKGARILTGHVDVRDGEAVDDFVAWAADPSAQQMKGEFYPWVDKSQLFADGYIAEQSGHSRGSTVDLTLVALPAQPQPAYDPGQPLSACTAPAPRRFPDNTIDMGTGYDCFDPSAHTLANGIQGEQLTNRLLLKKVLESQGFENYPNEWWHYTFTPEPFPDTYFDFPVAPSSLAG